MELNIVDKILKCIFKKYTYKIYCLGIKDGFEMNEKIALNLQ